MVTRTEGESGHHGGVVGGGSGDDAQREAAERPTTSPEPPWWTLERASLHRWLERNAPGLAPVYRAGLLMAMDEDFPGRVWFVAHAIREMRNRLPDALAGEIASTRTNYVDLAEEIRVRWIDEGLPVDGSSPLSQSALPSASGAGYEVSAELFAAVAELVAGHSGAKENNEQRARRLFEAVGGSSPPSYAIKAWLQGTRWANEFAHVRNKPLRHETDAELTANFVAFEASLFAIANRSYENLEALDHLLDSANER